MEEETTPYEDYVCLRLTETPDIDLIGIVEKVISKYVDKTVPYLFVREGGKEDDNPHAHGTFRVIGKVQAFRQWLGRQGLKGNESYSLKLAHPDKMDAQFRYLCKGTGTGKKDGPDVMFRHKTLYDAVIEEAHQAFWKENDELRKRDTKRKREEPAAKQILAICRQKIEHADGNKKVLSEDQIIDIVCQWYYEHKTSMNIFQMKAVVNYVVYGIDTDRGCDSNRTALLKQNLKL